MTPKVDTFEHDIAEEIKRKDASLTEISSASGNVGNNPEDEQKKPAPVMLIVLVTVFVLGLLGLLGLLYFYFTDSLLPPSQGSVPVSEVAVPKTVKALSSVSPTLDREIGRYATSLEKQEAGYILTISSYPEVFAYMVKNEDDYIDELAKAVAGVAIGTTPSGRGGQAKVSTTTSMVATSTPVAKATTTQATTTKTTKGTSTPLVVGTTTAQAPVATTTAPRVPPYYYDVTIANQNMRIWKNGDETVVYSFITTNKIAISRTTEGILALKNVIIR